MDTRRVSSVSTHRSKLWAALALASLMMSFVAVAPVQARPIQAQSALLEWARTQPDAQIQVIVQKSTPEAQLDRAVARLGGVVTGDLAIIHAFVAQLPARAVPALAQTAGVRWISLDAQMVKTDASCTNCLDTTQLQNAFISTIGADRVWNQPPYLQGQGIGVAVVDSGITPGKDLDSVNGQSRVVAAERFGNANQGTRDDFGHGNHVAGIIAGGAKQSQGMYIGVAPEANLINLKVSDDQGGSTASNVVQALQWVLDHKTAYNIRVVNLSLNSAVYESYHTNPLAAAVEVLWFNKIVVVVAAGNNAGQGMVMPPANDPFVITVGATDDRGTADRSDDVMAAFSAFGTPGGFAKPDLVAPGKNIISLLAGRNTKLARSYPDRIFNRNYFRMSGTSMSAPMVAGAAALILQANPALTPDQVKYRLKATAQPFDQPSRAGAGYLDVYAAVHGTTTESANTGVAVSQLLTGGTDATTWGSVNWDSVNWDSVNWDSVNWDSVNWDSVNWDSTFWGE